MVSDLKEYYDKWIVYIRYAMNILDRENGNMITLPAEGGLMDQPFATMEFVEFIQGILVEAITKRIKELNIGVKRP